jgi:hypothetical protein
MGIPNVKQKLTITGGGAPSISGIQDALGTLRQLGAPALGGKLTLQQNVNGWAIFIEWTPEAAPANPDESVPGPGEFLPRKIRDNPQA